MGLVVLAYTQDKKNPSNTEDMEVSETKWKKYPVYGDYGYGGSKKFFNKNSTIILVRS